jgi:hypothetical protein
MRKFRAALLYSIAVLVSIATGTGYIHNAAIFWFCVGLIVVLVGVATCTLEPVSSRIFHKKTTPPMSGVMMAGIFQFSIASSEGLSLQPHIFLRASVTNGSELLRVASWKLSASLEGRTPRVHGPLTIPESYVFYRSQPKVTLGLTTIVRETEYPTKRLNDAAGVLWQPHEMRTGWLYFTAEDVDENRVRDGADLTLEIIDTGPNDHADARRRR